MTTTARTIYIDESGDSSLKLESPNISKYFVLAAIIIDNSKLDSVNSRFEQIRKSYFQTGEMKSTTLNKNPNKRKSLISELSCIDDYRIALFCADKTKIHVNSALKYKDPFRKYLVNQLYKKLYQAYSSPDSKLTFIADEYGRDSDMASFKEYIRRQKNLFSYDPLFNNSKQELGIQVADIIAGTFRQQYESKNFKVLAPLRQHFECLVSWPPESLKNMSNVKITTAKNNAFDELVYNQSIIKAEGLLQSRPRDSDERNQHSILSYLLASFYGDASRWVAVDELAESVEFENPPSKDIQNYIKSNLIAGLRSKGAFITTGSHWGYKLPRDEKDLSLIVQRTHNNIAPQIDKIRIIKDALSLASNGDFDLLNEPRYEYLKRIIEDGYLSEKILREIDSSQEDPY